MISRPLLLAALALLTGCGGGGSNAPEPETGGAPTPPPPTTTTPAPSGPLTVTAGYGRVVLPGNQVTLSASVTEGEASTTTWRQTAGTPVTLNPTDSLTPSFTAPSPDASETLSFEVTARNAGNTAHVQPTGAYHYHGIPESLINRLGEGPDGAADMIAGGFAADGFPFYLRYGYRDPNDPQSGLVAVRGSWMLRPGTRPGGPYDGTFREDWQYVEGSGDLDECNGRFGVTPEHPAGTYHYYITDDYPYIPRCVFGTPDGSFRVRR